MKSDIAATIVYPPDMNTAGYAKENETKPETARLIAELADCVEPEAIVGKLIDAVERGDGDVSVGVDGWFCSRATIGFGPATTVMNALVEIALGGLMRLIALGYRKLILFIVRKGNQAKHKQE